MDLGITNSHWDNLVLPKLNLYLGLSTTDRHPDV
jgi:hypothetical protein